MIFWYMMESTFRKPWTVGSLIFRMVGTLETIHSNSTCCLWVDFSPVGSGSERLWWRCQSWEVKGLENCGFLWWLITYLVMVQKSGELTSWGRLVPIVSKVFFPWWLFGISEPSTGSVDLTPQPQDANRGKWRFWLGFLTQKCDIPGGDDYWVGGYVQYISFCIRIYLWNLRLSQLTSIISWNGIEGICVAPIAKVTAYEEFMKSLAKN